jgi:hypothetical protein
MNMETDVAVLISKVEMLTDRLGKVEQENAELREKASRVMGGLVVLIAIGSIASFALGAIDKVAKLWSH